MTRLSVNINDETAAFIKDCMNAEGRTATEIVRRMASVYCTVTRAIAYGERVMFVDENGSEREVKFL